MPDITFIQQLAREAGSLIAEQRRNLTINFKGEGATELVTQADVAADELITRTIQQHYPEHDILSEELSPEHNGEAEHLWVIDPIDGTVNYAHDHPQVAISIAYFYRGEVQLGVVYNPFSDELFHAEKGLGAWLNEQQIFCSDQQQLSRAIIATGFPYVKDNLPALIKRLDIVLQHCADIRRLGSAALDICWVACGRLDGYYETVKAWDFAAAQLIATEAGARFGHVYPVQGNPQLDGNHLITASPALYEALKSLLLQADQK